ncbi:MAG: phosphoribosyl-ATP diphosphatase [Rickettsiales bacterium]|nr:phosphoribosyl-ATP diphosphatase [Rickettsiales bacterium]
MKKQTLSFEELFAIVKHKIATKEKDSYSHTIAVQGVEKITRKVGEEALEVVIAAFLNDKNPSKKLHEELVGELCDLFYHSLILMAAQGIEIDEILQEFERRNNKNLNK